MPYAVNRMTNTKWTLRNKHGGAAKPRVTTCMHTWLQGTWSAQHTDDPRVAGETLKSHSGP
jgi:hypothetical protein